MSQLLTIPADYLERLEKKLDNVMAYIETNYETRTKWIRPEEAMRLIGCKEGMLRKLRKAGKIEWMQFGESRGVMILRKSVESFIRSRSTVRS